MLAAMAAAVEFGYRESGQTAEFLESALKALRALEREHGFFYHFYNYRTGAVLDKSVEVSSIDTALLAAGALTAGEYFGGGVKREADALYSEIDFSFFKDGRRKQFFMAYRADKGHFSHWDLYAEQLILYILAAGAPDPEKRAGREYYEGMGKNVGRYKEHEFVYSWIGSLFTHQYSHAFADFRGARDRSGTDWFENSVKASLASRQYCIDNAGAFKSYGADSWGLSSCAGKDGYKGRMGTPPSGNNDTEHRSDGTVAPYAAAASIVFTPEESAAALKNYYSQPDLTGKYGLYASFNRDEGWVSETYLGIDKGITALMLSNYLNGCVWKAFGKSEFVKNGLKEIGMLKE
jgi:hypothetical protein